jgi:uncharacterized membrane protein YphA (DoxX/SURF4 family)
VLGLLIVLLVVVGLLVALGLVVRSFCSVLVLVSQSDCFTAPRGSPRRLASFLPDRD